jgi:enamine deaminase RidA (YjgF/YER057c/UK114 family)
MEKFYRKNITYSLAPFGTNDQMFVVAEPSKRHAPSPKEQLHISETLWSLIFRDFISDISEIFVYEDWQQDIVMCNFFLADATKLKICRETLKEVLPKKRWGAITLIPQVPASGHFCAAELWAIKGKYIVQSKYDHGHYVTMISDQTRWFFGGNYRPKKFFTNTYERTLSTFDKLRKELLEEHFPFETLARTWIYQGQFLEPENNTNQDTITRYQELNRARTEFFKDKEFFKKHLPPQSNVPSFPASTGIGANDGLVISAVAVTPLRDDFIITAIENPNQKAATDYGINYSPKSPKFSRGTVINYDNWCQIFVSGTASITESESRHIGDVKLQTEQTLDNIAALIDGTNLANHGIKGYKSGLDNLKIVRVYIKNPDHVKEIKSICRKRLGNIPILYTIADVCRPELLVEIEGIAVTTREQNQETKSKNNHI